MLHIDGTLSKKGAIVLSFFTRQSDSDIKTSIFTQALNKTHE